MALMTIHKVTRRFDMVSMYIMKLRPSSKGFKKLLVIGHFLTKFMVSVPIENEESQTVAQALFEKLASIFGLPEKLLREKGGQMVDEVITYLCRFIGTKKVTTTEPHPQTD